MFLLKFYSAPDQKFLVFLINPHRDPISWFLPPRSCGWEAVELTYKPRYDALRPHLVQDVCAGLWKGLASSRAGGHKRARVLGWGCGLVVRKATSGGAAQREVEREHVFPGRGNSVSAEAGRQKTCVR